MVAITTTTEIHTNIVQYDTITTFPDRATMVTDMQFVKYLSIIFFSFDVCD